MAGTPETLQPEAKISEIPQVPEIPPEIERATGVKVVQKNFTSQIKNDDGTALAQTPPTQVITVQPPADDAGLAKWAGGNTSNALTWLGAFWLRIIKKALHFGWKIGSK